MNLNLIKTIIIITAIYFSFELTTVFGYYQNIKQEEFTQLQKKLENKKAVTDENLNNLFSEVSKLVNGKWKSPVGKRGYREDFYDVKSDDLKNVVNQLYPIDQNIATYLDDNFSRGIMSALYNFQNINALKVDLNSILNAITEAKTIRSKAQG